MNRILILFAVLIFAQPIFGQSKSAYKIYNAEGKEVSYKKMMKSASAVDVIFFGEIHNNPISHWLQYEVTTELSEVRSLTLGAEMFEADNQIPLNDYLSGKINYEELDSLARLWSNYETDYAPLVDFAKEKNLPFIATNIPRRFANKVYKYDFAALDSLSVEEKEWVAPLPIAFDSSLESYKDILKLLGDHGTLALVKAQATKDATMAYFISKNYKNGHLFIHYNGKYHSDKYEGILWYLKKYKTGLKLATISTISQSNIKKLKKEHYGLADFIICVDEDMTTSY